MAEDKKNLNILIDTSGSMVESGKRLITRGVVRQVEQYIRLGYSTIKLQLFSIDNKITPIEWNTNDEYPEVLFNCSGSLDLEPLIDFIKSDEALYLIVSDCSWAGRSVKKFLRSVGELPDGTVRIIKVGAEQSSSIKNIKVFESEDTLLALEGWIGALSL